MTLKSIIAKSIMEFRQENRLTQTELGEKLGVTASAVSNWENEINSVELEVLLKICSVFDVPLNMLLGPYGKACDFTDFEVKMLIAYRNHKDVQNSINKLLDL